MQVDPIKPTLNAPVSKRLKLEFPRSVSSFAFDFNLRRFTEVVMSNGGYTGAMDVWALGCIFAEVS